jgi:hypothetical protein
LSIGIHLDWPALDEDLLSCREMVTALPRQSTRTTTRPFGPRAHVSQRLRALLGPAIRDLWSLLIRRS